MGKEFPEITTVELAVSAALDEGFMSLQGACLMAEEIRRLSRPDFTSVGVKELEDAIGKLCGSDCPTGSDSQACVIYKDDCSNCWRGYLQRQELK